MYLINTSTLTREEHFFDRVERKYAILSHTWADGEVTFQDMKAFDPAVQEKPGWQKVVRTCKEASNSGLQYAWIDTCCIDKSSSSELSEAINSMYRWYWGAKVCYVYLSDVSCPPNVIPDNPSPFFESGVPPSRLSGHTIVEFRASRWFKRGWTLQELIAPDVLRFYSQGWVLLGQTIDFHTRLPILRRRDLHLHEPAFRLLDLLSNITAVPVPVLGGMDVVSTYSTAQIMSWAAGRSTTRQEDQAYCLLGLFEINMPLLYGEGTRAFQRLQEEIVKAKFDQSIFAWDHEAVWFYTQIRNGDNNRRHATRLSHLFAPSPKSFAACGDIVPWKAESNVPSYTLTNRGLEIAFFHPRQTLMSQDGTQLTRPDRSLAILQCRREEDFSNAVALWLSEPTTAGEQFVESKLDLDHHCAVRRTQACLRPDSMDGPFPTTILLQAPEGTSNYKARKKARRLVIEMTLPERVDIARLEPGSTWNHKTLVMTPALPHPLATDQWQDWESKQLCTAKVRFQYESLHYLVLIEYDERTSRISVMHADSEHLLDIRSNAMSLRDTQETAKTDGTDVFCDLKRTSRLGQDVMVLYIGLTRDLDGAESPGNSRQEREKQQRDVQLEDREHGDDEVGG